MVDFSSIPYQHVLVQMVWQYSLSACVGPNGLAVFPISMCSIKWFGRVCILHTDAEASTREHPDVIWCGVAVHMCTCGTGRGCSTMQTVLWWTPPWPYLPQCAGSCYVGSSVSVWVPPIYPPMEDITSKSSTWQWDLQSLRQWPTWSCKMWRIGSWLPLMFLLGSGEDMWMIPV